MLTKESSSSQLTCIKNDKTISGRLNGFIRIDEEAREEREG